MKDIKEIIHLYIGQEVWETFNNRKAKLVGVIQGDKMPVKCLWHDKADWAFDYDEVKLILRRLSSMDEIEKHELFKHIWPDDHSATPLGAEYCINYLLDLEIDCPIDKWMEDYSESKNNYESWSGIIDWLRSKGFWVGGNSAFDHGLIIDKATI